MEGADFGGYATRANLECTDGRTIKPEAFKHMNGIKVPLVWQHGHNSADNVLGHAILEARDDGVYAWGFFNQETRQGKNARALVKHKDLNNLSIYANKLVERSKQVFHGFIREVSLVLSGANPGALIDYVNIQHEDGTITELDEDAIIHTGLDIDYVADDDEGDLEHADEETIQDILNTFNEKQRNVLNFLVGAALEDAGDMAQSDDTDEDESLTHEEEEGTGEMGRNVFEQAGASATGTATKPQHTLSHSDVQEIVKTWAQRGSSSMKAVIQEYALQHGVEDMDLLFPDPKLLTNTPEFDKRRTEWVRSVLDGTHKSPFSRIKTISADITQDEARARGYVKGTYKKEEWFGLQKRVTTPTTVYKKQKFDRDDIIDITDFDFIAWVKAEMRLMLEEELARAILFGDGRDPGDEDKIKDPAGATEGAGIRAIANDHELYVTYVTINTGDANSSVEEILDELIRARQYYKGTGTPTLYTTEPVVVEWMLLRDTQGRKLYRTREELASELMVDRIVTVEAMEGMPEIYGIIVNLADYNIGADRGGEVNLFDDFDLDYNQLKYLIETRVSGALVKIKSALVLKKPEADTDTLVDPITSPTFVSSTGVVTIPSQTGVVYKNGVTGDTLSSGAQAALDEGETLKVHADPASTYYFRTTAKNDWTFKRPTA